MSAREQLREQVEALTEDEARDALVVLVRHRFEAIHRHAPADDEPLDDSELAEAMAQADRGETVSLAELRTQLDA